MIAYSLPKGEPVSGVTEARNVHTGGQSETCEGDDSTVLIQSRMQVDIAVVLDQSVPVSAITEMILEGRLVKSAKADGGMIAPFSNTGNHDLGNGMHVAHTVVCLKGRNVFLEVMNAQDEPIELKFGTKVPTFSPLVHSHSKTSSASCSVKMDNECNIVVSDVMGLLL